MNDDQFDELLRKAAEEYNRPADTPREEIWARVQAKRRKVGASTGLPWFRRSVIPSFRRSALPAWAAVAAVLALGIGIGRWLWAPNGAERPQQPVAAAGGEESRQGSPNVALAMVATQHLSRTETFLTSLRTDRDNGQFSSVARELLSTTRLLLDSPDLRDRRTRLLLEDLELVLAQIAQLPPERGAEELDFIAEGLEQREMMPRLRTAIPAGRTARIRGEL